MADDAGQIARPRGRPSLYTPELATRICDQIATTPRGLDFICESNPDFPSARTVTYWLDRHEDFLRKYLRARECQADLLFDECLEIADDCSRDRKLVGREGNEQEVCDTEFVQRARLRIDTRKWMAGKLAPKKYGESVDVRGTLTLETLVLQSIGAISSPETIEGEAKVIEDRSGESDR